jgi:ABC-type proline/glycine betaine transport system ATPase subunit
MAIVMVTHDVHAALPKASHVLHVTSGRQAFFGTAGEYKTWEASSRPARGGYDD